MMKQFFILCLGGLSVFGFLYLKNEPENQVKGKPDPISLLEKKHFPAEHFYFQRSYPDLEFDIDGYHKMLRSLSQTRNKTMAGRLQSPWTLQGPANIGGRLNSIAVHPTNSNIIMVGCAAGGIFKTTNGGSTWNPVFDAQPWLAIGDITFDPSNPNTVWAGTGDPNISGFPFIGDGIYKSTNGGNTWTHSGLDSVRVISEIIVHPTQSNVIYVAGMGYPMRRNNHRGVYKSTNGGSSWTQIHFVSNQAGIIDLVMNPLNPDTLYASSWDRIRTNQESTVFGPDAKIWKTTNGGSNWTQLTTGLPNYPQSRVNLAIAQSNPAILYAAYVDSTLDIAGIYKSTNHGNTWALMPSNGLNPTCLGGFGWYFANINVHPTDANDIYLNGVQLWRSTNGGQDWAENDPPWFTYDVHADKHDIAFLGGGAYLLATDGGLYKTPDFGLTWSDEEDLPNSQFYRVEINPHDSGMYYGGLQDNGSTSGNNSIMTNWPRLYGGDGFTPVFNPIDPNIFVFTTQNGDFNITDDGGGSFYGFTFGIDPLDRRNWDSPILLNPKNPDVYYAGTQKVYRNNGGVFGQFDSVSTDLTDGNIFGERFHTISYIDIDELDTSRVFAGTTDGNVWISTNSGTNWANISAGLPDRYVTSVISSPNTLGSFYVSHSGYKADDFISHVHKSTNNGANWISIAGDLPNLPINNLAVFPGTDSILAVATDAGVYITQNWGTNWERIGVDMPIVTIYDIVFDTLTRVLVAGTFARSMWTFPLDSLVPLIVVPPDTDTTIIIHRTEIESNEIKAFPNPARTFLTIDIPQGPGTLSIFDLKGSLMLERKIQARGQEKIIIDTWTPGIYFCEFINTEGRKSSIRFLKISND